jgi:uncharacterized RDD family membrane protein YckC
METIEGLNELIKNRLIEKKGNVKLTENADIVLYGRALEINENQLLFKVLEIEETIDWEEIKKQEQVELIEKPTCPKCNTVFSSEIKFCIQDGTKLVHPDKLIPKCVICNKYYNNGAKFCPNDGGQIKLDDEIIHHSNLEPIVNREPETQRINHQESPSYSPPNIDSFSLKKEYPKASIGKRFLAYLLDGIIVTLLFIPSFFMFYDFLIEFFTYNYYGGVGNASKEKLIFGLIFLILPLLYILVKDGLGEGQSLGKKAVDLMVININTNEPCTKLNSAGRNILYSIITAIPYIGFLLEVIMIFANPDGRKLSDLGAGTQVIDIKEYKSN